MKRGIVGIALLALASGASPLGTAQAAGSSECNCENVQALQLELRNAMTLRQRYSDKIADLNKKFGSDPRGGDLLQANLDAEQYSNGTGPGTASDGIVQMATGSPADIKFVPRGQKMQEAHDRNPSEGIPTAEKWVNDVQVPDIDQRKRIEKEWRDKGQDLCDHFEKGAIEQAAQSSAVCSGIAKIVVAHEAHHQNTCKRMGYYAFSERKPAQRLADEVSAYEQQIAQLTSELQRVLNSKKTRIKNKPLAAGVEGLLAAQTECVIAVKVSGGIDDLRLSGTICDTTEVTKLKSNLPINFTLNPSDSRSGSYTYRGRAVGTEFWGSGNYQLELEEGKGSLILDGSGKWWAKNPAGMASKGGPETLKATELKEGCK